MCDVLQLAHWYLLYACRHGHDLTPLLMLCIQLYVCAVGFFNSIILGIYLCDISLQLLYYKLLLISSRVQQYHM